ncbi:MAG: glycosyltransferase [Syntrophomonadaceae bacterium]|nr:glycosyltransferase [Syntrophomonadaceae bacterium]
MKIALVHDWVVKLGGAENCLALFHRLYPEAPLYTLFFDKKSLDRLGFAPEQVHGSMLQGWRKIEKRYRRYLPILPYAIEQMDLSGYDLIFSSSHCVAKGVLSRSDQLHICYCHAPARYAWDLAHAYLREHRIDKGWKSLLARVVLHYLRIWDTQSANRVDYFIASSQYTAQRIWRVYRRESRVIYPPVDLQNYVLEEKKGDYFIYVSRLVPYKKADLVIRSFNESGLPLIVVGDGSTYDECCRLAGSNVKLLGWKNKQELAKLMGQARALVFAADEDFGIVMVEAQACGTPVIALGRGGAAETVVPANGDNWDEATGVFFHEQNIEALNSAVKQFLAWEDYFTPRVIWQNAQRFGEERFCSEIKDFINMKYRAFQNGRI